MSRIISLSARRAMFAQSSSGVFPILIKIEHASLPEPLRFVNNTEDLSYGGYVYHACPFRFDPPDETEDKITNARITIDAIDQTIVAAIRGMTTPATLTGVAMYWNNEGTPIFEPLVEWAFTLRDVEYDAFSVSGTLIYEDRLDIMIPYREMTPQDVPGVS